MDFGNGTVKAHMPNNIGLVTKLIISTFAVMV